MKCSVCGSELPENSKFCTFCGNTVKAAAPEVPAYTPPTAPAYTPPVYNTPGYNYQVPASQQPSHGYTPPAPQQPTYTPPSYNPQPSGYQQNTYVPPVYTPPAPSYSDEKVVVPAKPVKKAKKSKKGFAILGVIAAILAVVIIAGVVVLNIPSVKVPLALTRSIHAYAGIADDIGLTDAVSFIQEDQAYNTTLALSYEKMNDMFLMQAPAALQEMKGVGIRVTESFSLKDRLASANLALFYKGSDLVTADLGIDDNVVWASVPALLKDKYALNTETLGLDLIEMGVMENEDGFDKFGFNFFNMMDLLMTAKPSEDIVKDFTKAAKDLAEEIEIEADGSDEIKVNGERINCSKYNVTISQDALEDYLDAIEDPMNDYVDQILDLYEDLFRSIGAPDYAVDEMKEELSSSFELSYVIDSLKDALDYIGDVELELYIKGGYVMAAVYELEVDDETMVITLNMGGEGKYVDNFSLTVEMEDYFSLELESSGNHTGKGGIYESETKLTVEVDGEKVVTVSGEFQYEPKKKEENLSFSLSATPNMNADEYANEYGPSATAASMLLSSLNFSGEGQLTVNKKGYSLDLEELSVSAMGMDLITLGLECSVSEYTGAKEAGSVKYIFKLSEDEMMALSQEISTNGEALVEELMEKLPFLAEVYKEEVSEYPAPMETYPAEEPYYG